jgi:hypothetical protein|tara:strand:+ start:207 stop:482 length:276 start_codon:yes stop_codon:yes gene_type:complete
MSETPSWYFNAACKGMPADYIKPSFCKDNCSVKKECLTYALSVGDWQNYVHRSFYLATFTWGGHSAYERGKVMKECDFKPAEALKILNKGD